MSKTNYLPDPALKAAVEMALAMEIPLFLTGEPGTGKTELAYWIAENYPGLQPDVLRFNVKTTSVAKDLLYRYDAIRHFRDSQKDAAKNILHYVHFEALGQAILAARHGRRHVVLVDEIDKAPRDFPNDLLFEFEKLGFRIDEATKTDLDEVKKPLLVITSNSEKNLPDAFLRRCAFFHIPFPDDKSKLLDILTAKGLYDKTKKQELVSSAVDFFLNIRKSGLRRNPATAELIAWVEFLWEMDIDPNKALTAADLTKLEPSLSMLGKNKEDVQRIKDQLHAPSVKPQSNI